MTLELVIAALLVFVVALLYSSVGHGGATGYLAVMSLLGFPLREVASVALVMNVLVAGVAFYQFAKAGKFIPKLAIPFLITSIPAAFLGGLWRVEDKTLAMLLAVALFYASIMLLVKLRDKQGESLRQIPPVVAPVSGLGIGLLSGILGIGGGVFLSPLVVLFSWATVAEAAALSSSFILANSLSGLAARALAGNLHLGPVFYLAPVALAGGFIGSRMGATRLSGRQLRFLLATVLLIAAVKAGWSGW